MFAKQKQWETKQKRMRTQINNIGSTLEIGPERSRKTRARAKCELPLAHITIAYLPNLNLIIGKFELSLNPSRIETGGSVKQRSNNSAIFISNFRRATKATYNYKSKNIAIFNN